MILIDRILEEDNKVLSGKYNSAAIFYHWLDITVMVLRVGKKSVV